MAGWTVVPNPETDAWKRVEEPPPGVPEAPKPEMEKVFNPLPTLDAIGQGIVGAGKGALHTISGTDEWARQHLPAVLTNSNLGFGPPANLERVKQMATPEGTAQKIGYGGEQVGEFLLPGGAEEKGAAKLAEFAPKLGKLAKPLARVLTSGVSSGAVNAAQGGSPMTGALMGAGGQAAGQTLKAAAPMLTGIAQGLDAPYAKTGNAILNETKGILPSSIRSSARGVLDRLNPELDAVAENYPARIPMASARTTAGEQIVKAQSENNPRMVKGIKRMGKQLLERDYEPVMGAEGPSATLPIPEEVPAVDYLNLKRGIGKALPAGSWSPESSNAFKGPRNAIYGNMARTFEDYVPEAKPLNSRISALIPATEKPKNFFFGHAFGPGVGATLGGVGGYRRGIGPEGTDIGNGLKEGALGALSGAAAGLAVPSAMNAIARVGYSPALERILIPAATGSVLQPIRKKEKK